MPSSIYWSIHGQLIFTAHWVIVIFVADCFQFIAENSITRCADHTSLLFIFKLVDLTSIYLMTYSWSAHIHCALSYCDFVAISFSLHSGKLNNLMREQNITAFYIWIGSSYQCLLKSIFMVSSYSLRIEFLWFLLLFVFQCIEENSITRCRTILHCYLYLNW